MVQLRGSPEKGIREEVDHRSEQQKPGRRRGTKGVWNERRRGKGRNRSKKGGRWVEGTSVGGKIGNEVA